MKTNRKKLMAGVRGDATPVKPMYPGGPLGPVPYGPKEAPRGVAKKKKKTNKRKYA